MNETITPEMPVSLSSDLASLVQEKTGQNVYLCYQCVKCTSGCPVAAFFDWQPNQVMRSIQLGQEDIALNSQTPWLCASCQTCTTRCPQGLDIAQIMDFLTREGLRRGIKPKLPEGRIFNEAFLREVRMWGRAFELGLMAEMKLRTGDLLADVDLGFKMIGKRKLAFIPDVSRPPRTVKPVPGASDAIAYYPGCSLHSTAAEYNESTQAVCEQLEIKLVEPHGWVCCGSSAAHRADPQTAVRLPMENLAIIEQSGFRDVVMPCAACFNRHKAAQYEIQHDEVMKRSIDDALGYSYKDTVRIRSLNELIHQTAGKEGVAKHVKKPLQGLRLVSYYGCLLTRPPQVTGVKNPENPTDMDDLLTALGAEVLDWSYKTSCCGAAHSLTRPDIVLTLSGNLIQKAKEAGADAIAVACPLCHLNLDARQFQMELDEELPVLYFTQLMALAFGMPEKTAGLHKNLVDPRPVLMKRNLL